VLLVEPHQLGDDGAHGVTAGGRLARDAVGVGQREPPPDHAQVEADLERVVLVDEPDRIAAPLGDLLGRPRVDLVVAERENAVIAIAATGPGRAP
jgi:hypothetical protein